MHMILNNTIYNYNAHSHTWSWDMKLNSMPYDCKAPEFILISEVEKNCLIEDLCMRRA